MAGQGSAKKRTCNLQLWSSASSTKPPFRCFGTFWLQSEITCAEADLQDYLTFLDYHICLYCKSSKARRWSDTAHQNNTASSYPPTRPFIWSRISQDCCVRYKMWVHLCLSAGEYEWLVAGEVHVGCRRAGRGSKTLVGWHDKLNRLQWQKDWDRLV